MKIGVLVSRFPYPLEKGDKLRIYHQIKVLSENNEIHLCAVSDRPITDEQFKQLKSYCKTIKVVRINKLNILFNLIKGLLFSKLPLQVAYFYKKSAKKEIHNYFTNNNINHLYCQLIRVTEYAKDWQFPKTLDYMDVLSKGMERRISTANFILKPFIKLEATRLKKYEHFIFNSFNHKTIISEQDRDLIIHAKNTEIEIIRNGVDEDFYTPKSVSKKYDILFTGNMSYPPNIEGALFLVQKIMPILWQKNPDLSVVIAGANPNQKVQKLAQKNVLITGWVDDIRDYYSLSRIFVAPMLIGTGLQNKLLEAMSMEIPCVTSTLANNALSATHKKSIMIANTVEEYCHAIEELLKNQELVNTITLEGKKFVQLNYNWEATTRQLENLFLRTWKN